MRLNPKLDHLDPALRVMVASDGAVTDMLQAICRESIRAVVLSQQNRPALSPIEPLELAVGDTLLTRSVFLQGVRTGTNHVYADSWISTDRIDPRFRDGLLYSDTPIGRLWRDNKVEIFKETLDTVLLPAGFLAVAFGTAAAIPVLVRTCRVFTHGRPVMLIRERFSPALAAAAARPSSDAPSRPESPPNATRRRATPVMTR